MRKVISKPTIWYLVLTAALLTALIYFGMVQPYIPIAAGEPIDPSYYDMNLYIGEQVPPNRFYVTFWGDMDFVEGFLFLFIGLVSSVLGITRAANRLESRQIFLISVFSVLFALMSLSMTDFAALHWNDTFRFYLFWVAFFGYPIALLLHFFYCLRPARQKWLWAPVCLTAAYGAAAFIMYLGLGLPFDIPERLYTYLSSVSVVIFLAAGSLGAKDKSTTWYLRGTLLFMVAWGLRLLIMALTGIDISFHNEFKTGLLCITAFTAGYMLFANTRELAGYKSGMQMMEIKNRLIMENYKDLESHFTQIAQMKHELRHHLFAIKEIYESGEHERLLTYLADVQSSVAEIDDPISCGNRVIQAILGHASRRAREMSFEIKFDILPLPSLSIPDTDLVSLLMNLLDNALESCARIQNIKDRWIKVRLKTRHPYLCLSVANARQGAISREGDTYVSSKESGLLHGHGIEIIRRIADKHDGFTAFEHSADAFEAEVALLFE
ncbi:MAG: GHKL domain-containing protein [Oscillospiraceae bacterium]|nr:GHKL domain-containing protein [Oscillospiraceae bacterium]